MVTENPSPDKQHDEFFKWIGICIKEWAKLENYLYGICQFILDAGPKHVAIIFYRTPTLKARLDLVNELILTLLPQHQKKDGGHDHLDVAAWKKLIKDTCNLMPTRASRNLIESRFSKDRESDSTW